MKKLIYLFILSIFLGLSSCETTTTEPSPCGYYNGKPTYLGEKGGCYYINSNGNKTYVDRSYCPCK